MDAASQPECLWTVDDAEKYATDACAAGAGKGSLECVCQARGWPATSGGHGARWLAAAEAAVLRGVLFFPAMEGLT